VYRALNLNSGRVVAVKRIQLEGKSEEEIVQLSNEVSLLKALVHPGVVKYEGLVRTEHYVNIILEYVLLFFWV
jgi:serine/threonine protein kinase